MFCNHLLLELCHIGVFEARVFDQDASEADIGVRLREEGEMAAKQGGVRVILVAAQNEAAVEFDSVVLARAYSLERLVADPRQKTAFVPRLKEVHLFKVTVGVERRCFFEHIVGLYGHRLVFAFNESLRVALVKSLRHRVLHPSFVISQLPYQSSSRDSRDLDLGFELYQI